MTTKRNKRGVPRTLTSLIDELTALRARLDGRSGDDAQRIVDQILSRVPWEALDQIRRARSNGALSRASYFAEELLAKVRTTKSRARKHQRYTVVREGIEALLGRKEASELLWEIAAELANSGLLATSERYRKRWPEGHPGTVQFFDSLREQVENDPKVISDLANGNGPRHAAFGLVARACGLSPSTVKKAAATGH